MIGGGLILLAFGFFSLFRYFLGLNYVSPLDLPELL